MKNILKRLLLVCLFIVTLPTVVFSQVSVSANNQKIKQVLLQIEKTNGYHFFYSDDYLDLEKTIDIKVKNESIESVLNKLFKDTDITYRINENKQIALTLVKNLQTPGENKKTISGIIADEKGEPVIGANISEKGTRNSAASDVEGKFSLQVNTGAVLVISYIGYTTQEIIVGNRTNLNITLSENTTAMDEVIVVGYGTQRKGNLTGSISSVKSDKLTVAPVTNVTNMLGGQLSGLTSKQSRGTPGSDDATLRIRGFGSPLVIVDGAETSMSNLDPSQIESISILKDASASIYGARAGNGVILVTTKRGVDSKPIIALNASLTLQGSTNIFPATSSGQRAQIKRETHINQGLPMSQVPYTEEEIQKFYDGTDPNYGNYDWFDATIRPWAPQQNHDLSLRGGTEKIKYYGYFGYNNQETILKNDGGYYTKYNLQSNIDAKITDRLTASVDLALTSRKEYFPPIDGINHANLWETIYQSDPRYPTSLPDPDKFPYANIPLGSSVYMTSTKLAGYNDNRNQLFRANGSLAYDFKFLKGLKAKASINYNYNVNISKKFIRQREFYLYDFTNDRYTYAASSTNPTSMLHNSGINSLLTQQYSLSYSGLINEIHNLSALVVYEAIDSYGNGFQTQRSGFNSLAVEQFSAGDPSTASNSSWENEMGRVSWISRINYSLLDRYLIETIFRADASAKFTPENRWGYFPSVSLGWIVSQEQFMESFNSLDNMKLRVSMGKSGYDAVGNFDYMSVYGFDGGYKIGDEILTGIYSTRIANPAFTWETMTIYNAGVDFSLWNRKLYGTGEIFYRLREDILGNRNRSVPSSFGANLPTENLNSQDTRGFELSLGTAGRIGDFSYDIIGNISWNRSKHVKLDEPDYENDDQKRISGRTGRWTDLQYGYVSDGLFTSQEEIDALPYIYADLNGNSTLRPGDVKYKNLNGDNVLDWRDQTIIGQGSMMHWMYGINPTFRYKNFDLNLLFQGAFGYTTNVFLDPLFTAFAFDNRWTEQNNDPKAIVPRPGGKGGSGDFNLHNTSFVRLKNASLGYDVPQRLIKKHGIEKVRIYLAGTNLFTLSSLSKYGVNPEQGTSNPTSFYPMQKTLSVGLNVSF
jgi:TonB-linked SusC/RagA family outer membrane protein